MAVVSTKVQSAMVIKFKAGVNKDGSDLIKGQRFSKVKVTAGSDEVLSVGTAIGKLLKDGFVEVVREDLSLVANQ